MTTSLLLLTLLGCAGKSDDGTAEDGGADGGGSDGGGTDGGADGGTTDGGTTDGGTDGGETDGGTTDGGTGDGGTMDERQARCEAAVGAAKAMLDSLSPELKGRALKDLFSEDRSAWTNLPPSTFPRDGISFTELSAEQVELARAMVDAALSAQGQAQVEANFRVEGWWKDNGDPVLDPMTATLVFFGEPSLTGGFAWQLDAHHLVINLTGRCPDLVITPSFWGTNPQIIPSGADAGTWPMQLEVERAIAFLDSLDEAGRRGVIISDTAPGDLIAGAGRDDGIPSSPLGMPAGPMSAASREALLDLIAAWVGDLSEPHALVQLAAIEATLDETWIAWAGETTVDGLFYYRIQGPEVFIELDVLGTGDHIHAVHRHPEDDYGARLLALHREEFHPDAW